MINPEVFFVIALSVLDDSRYYSILYSILYAAGDRLSPNIFEADRFDSLEEAQNRVTDTLSKLFPQFLKEKGQRVIDVKYLKIKFVPTVESVYDKNLHYDYHWVDAKDLLCNYKEEQ